MSMSHLHGWGRLAAVILVPGLIYTLRAGDAPATQLNLGNGQRVILLSENNSASGQGDDALVVRYQTDLSFDNSSPAMAQEATSVFHTVLKETTARSCSQVVISANEVPQGVVLTTSRSRNFIFDRDSSGHWQAVPESQE